VELEAEEYPGEHAVGSSSGLEQLYPAGQAIGADAPTKEYVPRGTFSQAPLLIAPCTELILPAGQRVHKPLPAVAYLPLEHWIAIYYIWKIRI
jgi:hypothetical protein